jgi:hypothetical protein
MEDKLVDGRCLRLIIDWKIHYPGTNDKLIDRDITQQVCDSDVGPKPVIRYPGDAGISWTNWIAIYIQALPN